jgi:hypothetical protein
LDSLDFNFLPIDKQHLLVCSIKPFEDELFSSWLLRLAFAHETKVQTFTRLLFPEHHIWNRDIDRSVSLEVIKELARRTNLSEDIISKTTLVSFGGVLWENYKFKSRAKWILPLGIYHRTWRNFGLVCCPSCLNKDPLNAYFRKRWRLSFSVVCIDCNCLLIDRCCNCNAKIIFFRSELGFREKLPGSPLNICYNCGIAYSSELTVNERYIQMQKSLYEILDFGYKEFAPYPFMYFEVLYKIITILMSKHGAIIFDTICKEFGMEYKQIVKVYSFEMLSVDQRMIVLFCSFQLLNDWPKRFIYTMKSAKMYSSVLLRDFSNAPYWYWSIVNENFYISNVNRRFSDLN